jgi:carbamoyl-phosphate synthase large subunit
MMGFSDARLAKLTGRDEARSAAPAAPGVRPVFKRIDTCAAEFEARRPTCIRPMKTRRWATWNANEAEPSTRKKVVILGGGPNRIGQGIEFDYCCCHACFA